MIKNNDFIIVSGDTDALTFCKKDQSQFSQEEVNNLLNEINLQLPELVKLEFEAVFEKILVLKAKNYVLLEKGKIKFKGSSLKSSTLEIGLREYIDESVRCLLEDRSNEFVSIYKSYVKKLHTINSQEEMKKWCSKKTLTEKVYESERANETKVLKAIEGAEYSHGDKIWIFFDTDNELKLIENFNGSYNIEKLLEKLYKCMLRFCDVIDTSHCINYKLKRSKKELEELLNEKII